jgi:FkbM family methyltransferase
MKIITQYTQAGNKKRKKNNIMFSQNDEEKYILSKFEGITNGIFLDIGAFDGKWASNTFALVNIGWGGICVEGSPFSFSKLFEEHFNKENIILLNAIISHENVSENERIVKFWESPNSAASTINVENYNKWKDRIQGCGHGNFKEMFIPKISFKELMHWIRTKVQKIDFLSIDIEGGSTDLALQFDPLEFDTTMICVEHDGRYDQLINHYNKYRFKPISINGENLILSR